MNKSSKRRILAVLGVVVGTQLLSACVVLPVPGYRPRAVVVTPGYGYPPPPPREYREPYWRR
jgi:hypothetical protein